jgi:hypothetical protein
MFLIETLSDLFVYKTAVCRHCQLHKQVLSNGLCPQCNAEARRTERYREAMVGGDKSKAITETGESLRNQSIIFQLVGVGLFLAGTIILIGKYTVYGLARQTDQVKAEVFLGSLAVALVFAFILRKALGLLIKWTIIFACVAFALGILVFGVYLLVGMGAKH